MRFFFSCAALTAVVGFIACSSSSETTPGTTQPENDGGGTTIEPDGGVVVLEDGSVVTKDGGKPVYVKTTNESFMHEGMNRIYILSVPLDYDASKKYPLYMWLHGNPGTAQFMLDVYPVDPVTKNEAIIVYPNAILQDWDHTLADNGDVTYLKALIDVVAGKVNIDKTRILLSGWSGGAFMSSQMACRYSGMFKAIGVHNGGAPYDPENQDPNYSPPCAGASIPVMVTFGENDNGGGDPWAAQYWVDHNGCQNAKSAVAPNPCETYNGCPADKPIQICVIPGGGHGLWGEAQAVTWAWFKSLP